MQSYSATITCTIVASFAPHGLITPKVYILWQNTYKCYFVELQTHFSQDLQFIGCDFSSSYRYLFHLIKHVSLVFNIYQ